MNFFMDKQSIGFRKDAQEYASKLKSDMVGHVYRHFKGNLYIVLDIAVDSEDSEAMVVYANYFDRNLVWVRPVSMFMSLVDRIKYPDVKQKYRFQDTGICFGTDKLHVNNAYDWQKYFNTNDVRVDDMMMFITLSGSKVFDLNLDGYSDDTASFIVNNFIETVFLGKENKDDAVYSINPNDPSKIMRDNRPILTIRGWGYLTGMCNGLEPDEAAFIQDSFLLWCLSRL